MIVEIARKDRNYLSGVSNGYINNQSKAIPYCMDYSTEVNREIVAAAELERLKCSIVSDCLKSQLLLSF